MLLAAWIATHGCASKPPTPPPPAALADAERLAREGARLLAQENWPGAAAWWQRAGSQYQLLNRLDDVALARHNEGLARRALGETPVARGLFESAARLNRQSGQTNAWWRNQLALFQLEVAADPNRALALRKELESRPGLASLPPALSAHWTHETARLDAALGHPDHGVEAARTALRLFEAAGDRPGAGAACLTLARAESAAGHGAEAEAAWRKALTYFEQLGHPRGVAMALTGLGRELIRKGETAAGRALLERARENFKALKLDSAAAELDLNLGPIP